MGIGVKTPEIFEISLFVPRAEARGYLVSQLDNQVSKAVNNSVVETDCPAL